MVIPAEIEIPAAIRLTYFDGMIINLKDRDTGDPIGDITDCKADMWIRYKSEKGDPVKKFSTDDSTMEISDGPNAEITIPGFKILFNAGTYYLDLYLEYPDEEPNCYIKATWEIEQNVTGKSQN